jgi:hypothetical protein
MSEPLHVWVRFLDWIAPLDLHWGVTVAETISIIRRCWRVNNLAGISFHPRGDLLPLDQFLLDPGVELVGSAEVWIIPLIRHASPLVFMFLDEGVRGWLPDQRPGGLQPTGSSPDSLGGIWLGS